MNRYISAALAEMDGVVISKLEYPGSWAMDQSSCRFLSAFIAAYGARRILEFGSGFSTLMMARAISGTEGNYLLSVDNSGHYSREASKSYDISGCQAKVEFRTARLRVKLVCGRLLLSYDLPRGLLGALGPFDLVLIDAPSQDYGREAVLYEAFSAVSPGGYIILDDANRGTEKTAVANWRRSYGDAIDPVLLEGIGNGLCVIEKTGEALPEPLPLRDSVVSSAKTLRNAGRLLLRGE